MQSFIDIKKVSHFLFMKYPILYVSTKNRNTSKKLLILYLKGCLFLHISNFSWMWNHLYTAVHRLFPHSILIKYTSHGLTISISSRVGYLQPHWYLGVIQCLLLYWSSTVGSRRQANSIYCSKMLRFVNC